ncbi:MAG: phosphate starvation-inducible protein PhoH [Lachnospiraceae bacterium]|nr:phosphate starvation-inducible protein PhoH [Lachnospiraceae bacterium]
MSSFSENISIPNEHIQNIFGQFDRNIKNIEKAYHVTIVLRGDNLKIAGEEDNVKMAISVIEQMINLSKTGNIISDQNINYAVSLSKTGNEKIVTELDKDTVCHTINGKPVKAKTLGQKKYLDAIDNNMIVFGVGPAGTGKTYLAMAKAITAFKNNEVNRIILTRPAIEAGEKLGFLPGDLQSKVDPYLRPLYDALYEIMGAESFLKNMEKGLIEVAPLAYMRGRTLDNAYIVLDEAQNTTPAQMKMFLTRIGFGSKAIITGDLSQKDLPKDAQSGLEVALKVLNKIDDISIVQFSSDDVVRHPLVQKIVSAYEAYEEKQSRTKDKLTTKDNMSKTKKSATSKRKQG